MKKVDWLKKQIKEASEGFDDLDAAFIPKFVAAVEKAGEGISRLEFLKLFESFAPSGSGPEHCDYMMLDTQLSYMADFSEVWNIRQPPALPELTTRAQFNALKLPDDFVQIGGTPDWLQGEGFPICMRCDNDMILFAQFRSLPDSEEHPELSAYTFGDAGNLYLFTCPDCGTFSTDWQCY